jgi:predicted nucleotidyltransferase
MSQQDIIIKLTSKAVKKKLMDAGIVHLRLFGSYAEDTATEDSDVDLLYEYDSIIEHEDSR